MSEEHYNNPDYWFSTLPFPMAEMQGKRVDLFFSDGASTNATLHVEAHKTTPALHRVSAFIDSPGGPLGPGPARQTIELRAHELSGLAVRPSWDGVDRLCLSLDAIRWAEAVPLPRQ